MSLEELEMLMESCKLGNRLSQKRLYQQFYSLGMSICIRYAQNREEAEEICHDSFVKIFSKIGACTGIGTFQAWMRQIFVRTAIDYFRKFKKKQPVLEQIEVAQHVAFENMALDQLAIDEKLRLVQALPAACRLAFNMYAIEGFSTAEIAGMLHISEGTVRANVAKARARLQVLIEISNKIPTTL
jgi:RNA polymerase sigma-70 factor (ECF subfamily)